MGRGPGGPRPGAEAGWSRAALGGVACRSGRSPGRVRGGVWGLRAPPGGPPWPRAGDGRGAASRRTARRRRSAGAPASLAVRPAVPVPRRRVPRCPPPAWPRPAEDVCGGGRVLSALLASSPVPRFLAPRPLSRHALGPGRVTGRRARSGARTARRWGEAAVGSSSRPALGRPRCGGAGQGSPWRRRPEGRAPGPK